MRKTRLIFFLPMFIFLGALTWAMQTNRTVLDGVYTEAQAMRGDAQFAEHCAKCHEGTCTDGPPLFGPQFLDRWREDTLDNLFTNIRTRMPRDDAGSLSENSYLDILAHILQTNRFPAGAKELNTDEVKTTLLVGRDGPKPLPSNALVQVVGCLELGSSNAWTLTKATEPVRARKGDEITPDEVKDFVTRALGSLTFRLPNATSFRPGFKLDAFNGHKVLAKGALVRQANNDRINLTSLETVAPSCAQ
jgi:mono/diheme cytochrome c family protein